MTRLSASDELRARFNLAVGCANWARATNTRGDLDTAEQLTREVLSATADYAQTQEPLRAVGGIIFNSSLLLLACLWTLKDDTETADDSLPKRLGLHAHTPAALAARVEPEWRSARSVAYRHACYYATANDHSTAIAELAVALQMPALRAWAPTDPWLTPLHRHPRWAELFHPQTLGTSPSDFHEATGSISDTWALLEKDPHKAESLLAFRKIEPLDSYVRRGSPPDANLLERLEYDVLRAEVLSRQGNLGEAATASAGVLGVSEMRLDVAGQDSAWSELELEALRTHMVSLALSGRGEEALQYGDQVRELASRTRSIQALKAVSTLANISLAKSPAEAETTLRRCLRSVAEDPAADDPTADALWAPLRVNLAMALLLQGVRSKFVPEADAGKLREAMHLVTAAYNRSLDHGQHGHAAAAALLMGILYAIKVDRESAVLLFDRAVGLAARAGHVETGWRSQINLACALYQRDGVVSDAARGHARGALEVMERTISSSSDATSRFRLIAVPLAHAARLLILADDSEGWAAIKRHRSLRACFVDVSSGAMREDRGGFTSHEWIRVDDVDYVIY